MIEVHGLTKLYDDHLAVDGVSFSLSPGQICGLVGPNGAGKTSTLRCLAGLIPATDGRMNVAGFDATTESIQIKRHLAYVPDDPPLFDDLSVGEHLDFIGRLYGIQDRKTKIAELLNEFELVRKYDAGAVTLSRGMRQKLAVCCAYLAEPTVLLLDEPLTGLDPPGIRTLLKSVQQRASTGTTVLISSHLLAMIQNVCSHLLVMKDSKAVFFGHAQDLRTRYANSETLEDAYFAATVDASPSAVPLAPLASTMVADASSC